MITCPYCKLGFEQKSKGRSLPQNGYYFGCVVKLLSEHTGFSADEMHEVLKNKFLVKNMFIKTKTGMIEVMGIPRSTTELTTVEFEEYLSKIRQWASEDLSVYIPLPNEVATADDNHTKRIRND